MARNEEKQLGGLNRLWLQKEREGEILPKTRYTPSKWAFHTIEGRIKDVHVPRPKLATLNSVAAVKKWIPSIKKEIEYYLQQSQLSHYPERKIAEFQQQIEQLEKEYKCYLRKLRSLDPTCKHQPWTPRAYTKRRADSEDGQSLGKRLCVSDSEEKAATPTTNEDVSNSSYSSATQPSNFPDQDLPLMFDHTKLAVAVAGSWRVSSGQQNDTVTLAHVLRSGLPNLHSSAIPQVPKSEERDGVKPPPCSEITGTKTENVLGLGCYSSSSDEET